MPGSGACLLYTSRLEAGVVLQRHGDFVGIGDDVVAVSYTHLAEAAARGALGLGLNGPPVDLLAQDAEGRKKAILLSDMESTVITNEMIDEIADLMGIKAQVADITRRTMNDELDFATAVKQRVALFKGQKASLLDQAARRIRIMPGAKAMVATMHALSLIHI